VSKTYNDYYKSAQRAKLIKEFFLYGGVVCMGIAAKAAYAGQFHVAGFLALGAAVSWVIANIAWRVQRNNANRAINPFTPGDEYRPHPKVPFVSVPLTRPYYVVPGV
jgi:hypothetical protein